MLKDELQYLEFTNNQSSLKLTLQGAHIFDFKRKGKEPLLFLSESAQFKKGSPIRGGIPICWPWFGEHPFDKSLPNHGFARILPWHHKKTEVINENMTKITLVLQCSAESLRFWPYDFDLKLEIIMSDILEVSLITKNRGLKAFNLSQALHSYLRVDDVTKLDLQGLDGCRYYNKLDKSHHNIQEGSLHFSQEVDRVYMGVEKTVIIKSSKDEISIKTRGSSTVVVWNPGKELVEKMPDLSDYKTMLCIESANTLDDTIQLQPNAIHKLSTVIS